MKHIVICGYYGFANSGDEAVLKSMIEMLRKSMKDVQITVLSNRPELTCQQYQVDAVYRYHLFKINRIFKKADLFLFGGGSLLQDITSTRSLNYYLMILKMAQKHHLKTMVYGNGVGPLNGEKSRKKVADCLNEVDQITLRDKQSEKLLKEIGVCRPKMMVTADPVFSLEYDQLPDKKTLFADAGFLADEKYAVLSVRPWEKAVPDFEEKLALVLDRMNLAYGITPVFVPMQYASDAPASKAVMEKMQTKSYLLDRELTVDEIFSIVSGATLTLGMRLHMLIYSAIHSVPVLALSYDPKVVELMNAIQQPFCLDVEKMEEGSLSEMMDQLVKELSERKQEISDCQKEMRRKAEKNIEFAIELLNE